MKKNNYPSLETKELLKKKKNTVVFAITLAAAMTILIIAGTILAIKDGDTTLLTIPFTVSIVLVMCIMRISEMNKELKSRS